MTRFLLIRHAHHDYIGRAIAGWLPGVCLSTQGEAEAAELPRRLTGENITAIYSSPLERALETAAPLSKALRLPIVIREALGELRFGDWTGRTMTELDADPLWHRFNTHRGTTRAPGGELMLESQGRMVAELERIRKDHPDTVVAVTSHSDIIRAALLHYLGMPIDFFNRIEIHPASVTVLEMDDHGHRVLKLNNTK
ncbi:MAG: histidine phosphatase family protein [Bryobacteraceae bacterium]